MRVKEEYTPKQASEAKQTAPKPYGWGLAACSVLGGIAGYLLYQQGRFTADGAIANTLLKFMREQRWLQVFGGSYFVLLAQAGLLLMVSLCCLGCTLFPLIFGLYGGAVLYLALDLFAAEEWNPLYWLILWLPVGLAYTALTCFSNDGYGDALTLWGNLFHPGSRTVNYKNTFTRFFYTLFYLALASGSITALGYLFFVLI